MTVKEYNICVDKYSDGVYRFILKQIQDEEIAKDIVQDTFTKMWLKTKNISFEKAKSYVFTTAYHTLIDYIRKNSRYNEMEDEQHIISNENDHYSDVKEVLDEALDRLSPIQKSVILLRDYEGYSYQEIADITNLSETQVKVYIYRGRMHLKKYLVSIESLL